MLGFCLWLAFWLGFIQNIPLSPAVQKDAAQVGWRLRMHLCASWSVAGAYSLLPQSMLGYISMTLNIKRVKKKKKRCFFRSHRAQPECEPWWRASTEVFTDSIVLARCKPHPHAHTYRAKLSFVYLWKMNLRKTSLLLYHLQTWAPHKPHICCESLFSCQTSLKMAVKLPQRDGACSPLKSKNVYHMNIHPKKKKKKHTPTCTHTVQATCRDLHI